MDTPVQDIIVGNIPGARGPDTDIKPRDVKYTSGFVFAHMSKYKAGISG